MEDKKDTRFRIKASFNKEGPAKYEYKSFQEEIENNGEITVNKVRIYTAELTLILISKELPALNMDTKEQIILNCFPYLETYIKAFNEGAKYFDNEFAILPNTLYGANAKQYVSDIHFNYFHKRLTGSLTGWHFVEEQYPGILTHKEISKFGYYSGIVSRVEEMVKKHPRLFQTFDKCEHDLSPQQTETKIDNDLPKQLIVFNEPETVNKFHTILKGYFGSRETDLLKALQGEQLETVLLFPHNQNKFVEVFRRAKYNGLLISSPTEIKNWLCKNFEFRYKRGAVEEIKKFNNSTVWDILTKSKNELPKKERICFEGVDWLPYKSKKQLDNEAQKEQL